MYSAFRIDMIQTHQEVKGKKAAFFDVDGTLVKATIVHYYVQLKLLVLHPLARPFWLAWFFPKILYYLLLDGVSRTKFNRVFYRNYRGMDAADLKRVVLQTFDGFLRPKIFPAATRQIVEHQTNGNLIVFVTGSLDFIVAPVADCLHADYTLSMSLCEKEGKFTGELTSFPLGEEEKALAIKTFAEQHELDLSTCYAYGDSCADLPMLRSVGYPAVVNPDKQLRQIARHAGWDIHEWALGD